MELVKPYEFEQAAMRAALPQVRDLRSALDSRNLSVAEGCKFSLDQAGRIIFAEYRSGAAVRRHPSYVVARDQLGSHWYVDRQGRCLPLD